ncbi:MAG: hypothetical protein HY736_14275 [Verrucomicrobia bacterium]|nr:hypothetical protein [Verrucomicrobiota bacterium]
MREYLAASWVNKRMAAGCSLDEHDGLFFDHIGGRRVLRSSRGAVAAWLCAGGEPWNAAMRRWVLESSPDLNLRYGDPHSLPLDYKQALLAKLVEAARTRGYRWLETDQDALSRLTDPAVVPQIEAIIRNRELAGDLRASSFPSMTSLAFFARPASATAVPRTSTGRSQAISKSGYSPSTPAPFWIGSWHSCAPSRISPPSSASPLYRRSSPGSARSPRSRWWRCSKSRC